MTDIDTFGAVRDVRGLATPENVAAVLGCTEDEARQRLDALAETHHVTGPQEWSFGEGGVTTGYGLTSKGQDALDQ